MAKKIFNRRTLALVLALVMCFGALRITAYAAPSNNRNNWNFAYYLGQEYLGNAPGRNPKPDPVGYGFQGVITELTFLDDANVSWTFKWSAEANGEWRITGNNVSKEKATAWPEVTPDKAYVGYCGSSAYVFTLSADGSAASWTYVNESNRHVNWFYYIRFIREYTVNVFYQNETGSVEYKGVKYAAQDPLVRYFQFLYPNGNIIDDSEFEDGEYTDPVTLLPQDYLSDDLLAQGYELKYATDADGRDVMATGVTISLLGENILNVYCTLVPPKTENYKVIHAYYTEGSYDGRVEGGTVEVEKNADFAQIVEGIEKLSEYNGNAYGYVRYSVDPAAKVITLTYSRELPTHVYTVTYNANFGQNPETKADSENVSGVKDTAYTITADENTFSREYYSFIGWNTEADGSGTAYAPGAKLALTADNNSMVLYAQWKSHEKYDYTLIYNANFGENPETKADSENVSGIYAPAIAMTVDENTFVRENYTFVGWNTRADGTGTAFAPGDALYLTSSNNTALLYAQWQENPRYDYTLIYNANFGTAPETKIDSESISGIFAKRHAIGVDANSFVRENYTFIGWNTEADGSGEAFAPGARIMLTAENNTAVLYAQWVEFPKYDYTLTYNANFGENPETKADSENVTDTYALRHSFGVDTNSFVREDYTFVGWNTEADGSGTAYSFGDVLNLTAEDNTEILYAQWQENPKYVYVVVYNANFGENPEVRTDDESVYNTYAARYTIGVDANTFVRENYTFIGWATSPEGEVVYQAGDSITFVENGTVTLYAKWVEYDKYSYSLIYNGNGGALADGELSYGDSENVEATYATTHNITVDANTFVRENYTFTGWNTEADGSGVAYAAEDVVALTAENNTATLYAQWIENPKYDYSLIYNVNYGETPETREDGENVIGTYAAAYSITVDENTFAREGHTFIGWSTSPEGEVVYQAEAVIRFVEGGSATLYAQWQINEYDYTVRYMVRVDGGQYKPFQGALPEDAPVGGKAVYGQIIDETTLEVPETLYDGNYAYDFTALEGIVVPQGANIVFVYYTYITPQPPVNPPADPEDPSEPPVDEPVDPQDPGLNGLVEIPDEDVPLADVPKTGDPMLFYVGLTALSGLGLLGLGLKKKEEKNEA